MYKSVSFSRPNLNAPRWKEKRTSPIDNEFVKYINESLGTSFKISELKSIIRIMFEAFQDEIINNRDGIHLPEALGDIFLGTCSKKTKTINYDYENSLKHGKVIETRNYDSDQHLAKIFHTFFGIKKPIRNASLWSFHSCRDFARKVSKEYPRQWAKYIKVDKGIYISDLIRPGWKRRWDKYRTQETHEKHNIEKHARRRNNIESKESN